MSLRIKNIIYTLVLLLAMYLVWKYRDHSTPKMVAFSGQTMGPIVYSVKYFDEEQRNFKPEVDSLLDIFNESLNTYRPESEITKFNKGMSFKFDLPFFYKATDVSYQIYKATEGAFDPSIGPLINAWGFGYADNISIDSARIDSIRLIVGLEKISYNKDSVWKEDIRQELSYSASAKGYGVDVVLEYLESKGLENIFVEIGGEVRAAGMNLLAEEPWKVGILSPESKESNPFPYAIASVSNRAMATSGNYFNYRIIDSVKYSHTISPATGYPIVNPLLSATVFADDCMRADALATAFMVMGHEKAIDFLSNNPQYDAYLIFSNKAGSMSTYVTDGMADKIKKVD